MDTILHLTDKLSFCIKIIYYCMDTKIMTINYGKSNNGTYFVTAAFL
jgi:hypothetical protein